MRVHVFECDHTTTEFSENQSEKLNGTSSGTCGLNLGLPDASRMTLYMFGFDMCRSPKGEAYWHPATIRGQGQKGGTKDGQVSKEWASRVQ
jgi:hypothetical protein